ncbi:NYN domain-containing protein [Patescibacteria group bacterium]|nr:NYN domain-containing protein [Patescibacteria group bacterium]
MKKRVLTIIDGSNLYYKLKDLKIKKLVEYDYAGLVNSLLDKNTNLKIKYYIGAIRTDDSKKSLKMFRKQRKLLANLKKQKIEYFLGYLLKSGGKYHEKGVDVQMVVDMLKGAYKDEYDKFILVSSDSDLVPAIEAVQNEDKEVVYVGFKHKPSYALLKSCRRSIILEKKDVEGFINV